MHIHTHTHNHLSSDGSKRTRGQVSFLAWGHILTMGSLPGSQHTASHTMYVGCPLPSLLCAYSWAHALPWHMEAAAHRPLCFCAHSCLGMENAAGAWDFSAGQTAPSAGAPPAEAAESSCSLRPPRECKAQPATTFAGTHFLLEENLKWSREKVQRWLSGKMPYSRIPLPL